MSRRTGPPRQHIVRGHRCVSDEPDLSPRGEEARTHTVLAVIRRKNESRVGVVELARNGEHLCFGESICVEHDTGWVTGEAIAREGIYLVNLNLSCHERILNLLREVAHTARARVNI